MRTFPLSLTVIALSLFVSVAHAQMSSNFTSDLSLGSRGAQVTALQQVLNQDPDTRIVTTGPGSPGQETDYFGPLTKTAVIRFQEKYTGDILTPAGLTQGNGFVRANTRAKLNALSVPSASAKNATTPTATTSAKAPASATTSSAAAFLVKDSERTNVYVGNAMLANVENKMYAAINAGITSSVAAGTSTPIKIPTITTADVPGVTVGIPVPRSGGPGTYVSVKGAGLGAKSVVYFGSDYIVRTVSMSSTGDLLFVVPTIPPGRYDLAVRTGSLISNTQHFVITDPKNPPVRIQSVSPNPVVYGSTLTITGSGFSPTGNVIVTTYQTFTSVPSADGTTLVVQLAPEHLQGYAKVSNRMVPLPMSLYVVNDYGFSDAIKSFTMTI